MGRGWGRGQWHRRGQISAVDTSDTPQQGPRDSCGTPSPSPVSGPRLLAPCADENLHCYLFEDQTHLGSTRLCHLPAEALTRSAPSLRLSFWHMGAGLTAFRDSWQGESEKRPQQPGLGLCTVRWGGCPQGC